MQFITLVQIRPGGASVETGSRVAAHAAQWEHLQHQIQLVGGKINQTWNILGNDYDLMFLGEADDPSRLQSRGLCVENPSGDRGGGICPAGRGYGRRSELRPA